MLILTLTLCFIFSISIVSASDIQSIDDNQISYDNDTEIDYPEIDDNNLNSEISYKSSVSKDFDLFGLFDFFDDEKKYGYWVWATDMEKVDFDKLSDNGVKYIFLNSFAFTEYGQRDVLDWIKEANDHGIEVHIWMQIFNTGSWISPLKNGTPDNAYFNYKIEEARYYAGLEGVDGIELDYIRFEGTAYKYENGTKAISLFVKNLTEEVREINPDLTISATVMPEADKDAYYYGQDIKNISSYVDIIIPMIYKGNYNENSTWIKNTTEWFVENSGDAEVWCGLQTYRSDYNTSQLSTEEITKDVNYCFDGGAKGVVFFKWGMNNNLENINFNNDS